MVSIVRPLNTQHSGDFFYFFLNDHVQPPLKKVSLPISGINNEGQKIGPPCNSKTLYVMVTKSREESSEPKVRDVITFLLGGKKHILKLVLMDSTSSSNSLISFSFKWHCCSFVTLKSPLQKPVLPTHLSRNHH